MVNHRYKRAVLGITTALVVSACTVPAMAAPITINTDQSISVVSTDSTYVGGLDLEARIITTVEQDQRSPYAKKGIAVADDYLKIHTEPNGDADVVGKLYSGSGCEIEEVKDGWAHITSGDCMWKQSICSQGQMRKPMQKNIKFLNWLQSHRVSRCICTKNLQLMPRL